MEIVVLYFDGCPAFEQLLPRLHELVAEAGGDPDRIALHPIETHDDARAAGFLGSPTVRIDGEDVEPGSEAREDFGMQCRIYRYHGGARPTPPDEWIRRALANARLSARRE